MFSFILCLCICISYGKQCEDDSATCLYYSGPVLIKGDIQNNYDDAYSGEYFYWEENWDVWTDSGFKIHHPNYIDYFETNCKYSMGLCGTCVDNHARGDNGVLYSCQEILDLIPDACSCLTEPDSVPKVNCYDKTSGGVDLLWMRNKCRKTCFDAGKLPPHSLCNDDICNSPEKHPCTFPFEVNGKTYDRCITIKEFEPDGYEEHKQSWGKSLSKNTKWCSRDPIYNGGTNWSYCTCDNTMVSTPTLPPTTLSPITTTLPPTTPFTFVPTIPPTKIGKRCNSPSGERFAQLLSKCMKQKGNGYCDMSQLGYAHVRICADTALPAITKDNFILSVPITIECIYRQRSDWIYTVFEVYAKNVRFEHITFENCPNGVFFVDSKQELIVVNSTFNNNGSHDLGTGNSLRLHVDRPYTAGGVVTLNTMSRLRIEESTFRNNRAIDGAVLYSQYSCQISIYKSIFENNHAQVSGGVMSIINPSYSFIPFGDISLFESIFHNNSGQFRGSVFNIENFIGVKINVYDSHFSANGDTVVHTWGPDKTNLFFDIKFDTPWEIRGNEYIFTNTTFLNNDGIVIDMFHNGNTRFIFKNSSFESNPVGVDVEGELLDSYIDPHPSIIFSNTFVSESDLIRVYERANIMIHNNSVIRAEIQATLTSNVEVSNSTLLSTVVSIDKDSTLNISNSAITFTDIDCYFGSTVSVSSSVFNGSHINLHYITDRVPNIQLYDIHFENNADHYVFIHAREGISQDMTFENDYVIDYWDKKEVITCTNCSFDTSMNALPFTSVPNRVGIYYPGGVSVKTDLPTCEEITFMVNETIRVYSGQALPTFCIGVLDAFDVIIISRNVGTFLISHHSEEMLVNPALTTLVNEKVVEIKETVVYGNVGSTNSIWVTPSPIYHGDIDDLFNHHAFNKSLDIEIIECPDGFVLDYIHDQDTFRACRDSSSIPYPGWYLTNASDLKQWAPCPKGTQRPHSWFATQCYACPPGTVSTLNRTRCDFCQTVISMTFDARNDACTVCPEGAQCFGGDQVVPQNGFYHQNILSEVFSPCLNDKACSFENRTMHINDIRNKSGISQLIYKSIVTPSIYGDIYTNQTFNITIDDSNEEYIQSQCSPGYTSNLCGSCANGYQRKSMTECAVCASKRSNILFFVFTFMLLLVFLMFTVFRTFVKRDKTTLAVKTVIGFIQQLSVLITYRIGWPESVLSVLSFTGGISSGELTSIGCILEGSLSIPLFLAKSIMAVYVVPIVLMCLIPIFNVLLLQTKLGAKYITVRMTRGNILTMIIIVYFFVFPFIVVETITLFSCVTMKIDASTEKHFLMVDTKYECFVSPEHKIAVYSVGIPSLVLFIIGLPGCLLRYLFEHSEQFEEDDFKESFGFIYVGMKLKRWWWFFVLMIRTTVLVIIGMTVHNPLYQNLLAQLWLISYIIIVLYIEPYTDRGILKMELLASICIWFLLFMNIWMYAIGQFESVENIEFYNILFSIAIIITTVFSGTGLLCFYAYSVVSVKQNILMDQVSLRTLINSYTQSE